MNNQDNVRALARAFRMGEMFNKEEKYDLSPEERKEVEDQLEGITKRLDATAERMGIDFSGIPHNESEGKSEEELRRELEEQLESFTKRLDEKAEKLGIHFGGYEKETEIPDIEKSKEEDFDLEL